MKTLRLFTSSTFLAPMGLLVVLLIIWEFAGRQMNPLLFAPPTAVAERAVELWGDGEIQSATIDTLRSLLIGFGLAAVMGVALGVLMGRYPLLRKVVDPYLDALYATPRVVIIPLVIVWFGIGVPGIVFLAWYGAFFPIVFNTTTGVRQTRPDLVEVAQSFQARGVMLARHILLPAAMPYVLAGFGVGAGRALIGVVMGEIFLDLRGLGGLIQESATFFDMPAALVGIVIVAIMGTILLGLIRITEQRLSAWKG